MWTEHGPGWGELFYCQRQCLPKTLKTMPKPLKWLIKRQLKATASWAADLYTPGLFHQSGVDPTSWLCSSWSTGSLCEWIYVVQVFKSEACVSSWDSLSHTHDIWLAINSTSRSSWVSCSAPSLKCYSISLCLPHPSPYFYHCPCNPFPTSLPESFPEYQIHYTSSMHGTLPSMSSSQTTAARQFSPFTSHHNG